MDTSKFVSARRWARLSIIVSIGAGTVGCAHTTSKEKHPKQKTATKEELKKLKSRIEELEKTNGRLTVRIDKMEDEIFLLQDRVEAHRLALKRRGFMNRRTGPKKGKARAPEPTPQTNYGQRGRNERGRYDVRGSSGHSRRDDSLEEHPVKRIELSEQQAKGNPGRRREGETSDETRAEERARRRAAEASTSEDESGDEETEKVVITDSEFKEFAKKVDDDESSDESTSEETAGSNSKDADRERSTNETDDSSSKKPVTDERLAARKDSRDSDPSQRRPKSRTAESKANVPKAPEDEGNPYAGKSGLDLYKTALAKYRAGTYATALRGFKKFMESGPRKEYRDNGLYWIGECQYGLGNYQKSIEHFQRVLDEVPSGNKVPDAMLKMALAYREVGKDGEAKKLLERLTDKYPSTNAGRLGEKKLSDWGS